MARHSLSKRPQILTDDKHQGGRKSGVKGGNLGPCVCPRSRPHAQCGQQPVQQFTLETLASFVDLECMESISGGVHHETLSSKQRPFPSHF